MPTIIPVTFPHSWKSPDSPGYGTYPGPYRYDRVDRYEVAVATAIAFGYRHIDTAQTYENEAYVGRAIRAVKDPAIPRKSIFLTSKLHPNRNSYDGALDGIRDSCHRLGLTPDLYLVHYPGEGSAIGAYKGLIEAKSNGLCQHIGVSNFEVNHLRELCERTGEHPAVNQIGFHPHPCSKHLLQLIEFCQEHEIQVEGYCPFAQGKTGLLREPTITRVAATHNSSPSRVILRWCMQHGVRPLVGSLASRHIAENIAADDFALSNEEIAAIDDLGRMQFRISLCWGWDPTSAVLR